MKPILSRVLCASAALADVSASELATRAGLTASRISQLRSGVAGSAEEIERLMRILGFRWDTLIQLLGAVAEWTTCGVEELLCALLLSFDQHVLTLGASPPRIACDRLGITLRPTSRGLALIEEFIADAMPLPTDGNYKRAGRRHRVWIGSGLRWLRGNGARIDFNPSNVGSAGKRLVAAIVAEARDVRFSRVDVAVDLAASLLGVQAIGTTQRKATAVWNRTRVETIYVGSDEAKLSFAIYDRRSKLSKDRDDSRPVRVVGDDLTRFEARLKKRRFRPAQLATIRNPFRELRLLWLDGNGLALIDQVLVRLAQVVGFPLVERRLPEARRERLRRRFLSAADKAGVPHPRDAFEAGWRAEADRVLDMIGLGDS